MKWMREDWAPLAMYFAVVVAGGAIGAAAYVGAIRATAAVGVACVQAGGTWDNKAEKCEAKR